MNIEEDSLETKVCTSYDEQVQTVLLLSKAGYSQTNPDQTFIAEIANLNLQNVESYFISPIEFNFINIQELGQLISTVNKWHGIILTSIRCVDALIQSFNLLSEREIILAKWQQSTIFTVGDATKQYLLDKLHLDSIGHQSSNSETLAKFILDLNREQPIKLPLLYPCSNIRSESISKSLQGIIPLHEVFCYETIPNQHLEQEMKMFRQHIDRKLQSLDEIHLKNCKFLLIVVFFSPSGVMNLFPHICRDLLSLNNTLVVKFVAFGNVTAAKMTDLGIEEDVKSAYRIKLESWLNKNMKIKMSDNRTIVGIFLCTDCHRNIILGSSLEYLKDEENEEPRILGLAMIPGAHIVSIHIDEFMDKSTGSRINDSS